MTAQQLKNSILQMAVQGKLVPQDPNDEPASVLLERIRAEKERLIKEKKIKREKNPSVIFRGADNTPYEKIGNEVVSLEDEIPFEIPDSWEWVRLGIVSTYAETKEKINAQNADRSIWGLDLEDIEKGGRLLCKKRVSERKAFGDKTLFFRGDILYSKLRPYLLKILVADDDGICTPEIVPFKMYGGINPEYIVFYLQSPYVDNYINSITYGVKMPRVGTETMVSLLVPLPPLNEQNRIVNKIKEVIPTVAEYEKATVQIDNLNNSFPEQLKKSILQWAVQGKLVPQDEDDEPAEELLKRIRAEKETHIKAGKIKRDKHESVIFRRDNSHYEKLDGVERCIDDELPFEIPDSWQWARLGTIGDWGSGATPSRTHPEFYGGDIPWLKTGDLTDTYIDFIPESISQLALEKTSVRLNETGSVLMAMYGATIGKLGILTFPATTNQACCACKPLSGVEELYLFYFLMSQRTNFIKRGEGGAQPNISKEKIVATLMPLPPVNEQHRIVQRIEELLPLVKEL